jgi:3-phosphoshikimate 1-carboxyvinyltransferase
MVIHGGKALLGKEVQSHGDHRLAMSLAIAGLVAGGITSIQNARVTEISNPDFWQELNKLARY